MLRKMFLTIAAGAAALAFGAASSQAAEITFGTFPTPAGCAAVVAGQQGAVCPNGLTFNGGTAGTLTATAFSGSPNGGVSTETFLTFKASPPNSIPESGLGENSTAPGSPGGCTDAPDCEILGPASVAISSGVPLSQVDVLIGSVQPGETFNIWAGNSFGSLTEIFSGLTFATCTQIGTAECQVDFAAATIVAVQSAGAGDVLLTGVSTPTAAVPEPAALALLGTALLGMGMFRRRRQ